MTYDSRNLSSDPAVRRRAVEEYRVDLVQARKRFAWIWLRNRFSGFALLAVVMLLVSAGGLIFGRWVETTPGRVIYFAAVVTIAIFALWLVGTHPRLNSIVNKWASEEAVLRSKMDSMRINLKSLSREFGDSK